MSSYSGQNQPPSTGYGENAAEYPMTQHELEEAKESYRESLLSLHRQQYSNITYPKVPVSNNASTNSRPSFPTGNIAKTIRAAKSTARRSTVPRPRAPKSQRVRAANENSHRRALICPHTPSAIPSLGISQGTPASRHTPRVLNMSLKTVPCGTGRQVRGGYQQGAIRHDDKESGRCQDKRGIP